MKTKMYYVLLVVLGITACEKDPFIDTIDEPVINKPIQYTMSKEKEYVFDMNLYGDTIRFFKYKIDVVQKETGTKDSTSMAMASEANEKVTVQNGRLFLEDIGIELNEVTFPFKIGIMACDKDYMLCDVEQYKSLGRDSLLALFATAKISGHTTTFPDLQNNVRPTFMTDYINLKDGNRLTMYVADENGYGDIRLPFSAYQVDRSPKLPDSYQKEYLLVKDRFDGRTYSDDEGNRYETKLVLKPLLEMKGYDPKAVKPRDYQFNEQLGHLYPVMQLYKNDVLLYETRVEKYTEEYEYVTKDDVVVSIPVPGNKTRTNIEFRSCSMIDGCYVEVSFESYYGTFFKIRKLDFGNPAPGEEFSTKSQTTIQITDDMKPGSKQTISIS